MSTRGQATERAGSTRTGRRRRLVALVIAGSLAAAACSSGSSSGSSTTTPGSNGPSTGSSVPTTAGTSPTTPTTDGGGSTGNRAPLATGVRLAAGHAVAPAAKPTPIVAGAPIDDAGVAAVVARLPEWTTGTAVTATFNWPTESKPEPQVGATVDAPFPAADPAVAPPATTSGPLHVVRSQPNGDVAIAPFVSITFDQPMVPVATISQLADADVPATITPAVPGHWQWIGTQTLRFDATSDLVDRLPMATDYTVTVPAGTTSATGGVLADAATFTFSTPTADVQTLAPTGPSLPLTPVFVAVFDQRIDPRSVLDTTVVTAGDAPAPMRLATSDEIAADANASQLISGLPDGRWMAFRPVAPFAPNTSISIAVGPGTPSAEGPKTSTQATSFSGSTYAPLAVTDTDCGGGDCTPGSYFGVTFDNVLDLHHFDPSTVTIDPALPGASVSAYADSMTISGATVAHTTYHVTLPAGLTDIYGQQLGKDTTVDFSVGAAAPSLRPFTLPLTTLDPLVPNHAVSVVTVSHTDFRVRTFQVTPADWASYVQYFTNTVQSGDDSSLTPPWKTLSDAVVSVDGAGDQQSETSVDLSGVLAGHGQVVVLVEPTEHYGTDDPDYWSNRPTITWVQSTSIGVDAINDTDDVRAWTTDLRDGSPLAGVSVTLLGDANTDDQTPDDSSATDAVTTDADGLATIPLTAQPHDVMVATKGDDTAILPSNLYGGAWQRNDRQDDATWYVFDDRQIYRPSETVSMKGWVRRLTSSGDSQLQLLDPGATVNYTVTDAQGSQVTTGTVDVGALGGFDFTFDVPADAALGTASVQLDLVGASGLSYASFQHTVQFAEFRRPEFEVDARSESEGPYIQGTPLTVAADANYYAGGPLGAAPVSWTVTTAAAEYSPPGWDDYDFGVWTPWWYATDTYDSGARGGDVIVDGPCCGGPTNDSTTATYSGVTDASGTEYLQIDAGSLDDDHAGLPVTVTAQASVTDVNRQALASTTSVLVHPADDYVGLHGTDTYVRRGDPLVVDAVVTDVDGKATAGRAVHVTAGRTESVLTNGTYVDTPVGVQTCDLTSTTEPQPCTFDTTTGGTYTITATVTDGAGRTSRTEITRWVSGADVTPSRTVDQQQLTLVPDKQTYAPGDSAQLLVQVPFATGDGLLTVSRSDSTLSTIRFTVADGSAVVPVPIADADIPGVDVSIEVVGTSPRADDSGTVLADAPQRPAFATGSISLAVSTASRTLTVTAVPKATTVEPGTDTSVAVTVTDHAGKPVEGSELAVVVVDEAVLALTDDQLQDPLATFYAQLPSYVSQQYGRSTIVLADPATVTPPAGNTETAATTAAATADTAASPATTAVPASAAGGAADADGTFATSTNKSIAPGGDTGAISVRTDFDALAVFEPSVLTDANGTATVDVPLPDNLTRYRVMVVAVDGADTFGSAQANITARLPLMVRPSAPRFLNFGDTFELPVVVQNQTDSAMDVDVVLQADNLTVTGADGAAGDGVKGIGQRVTVPANDRVEVRFPVSAASAGTARFRVAAASGDASDAATVELPVYTPATAEAFATYGVIDDGTTEQPIATPTGVIPEFGGLDVTTSSTSLQALTDAVLYIDDYPYESSDALASRILAISSLRDVLAAFDAPGLPTADELNQTVRDDIESLVALQSGSDGGFPYWSGDDTSDPFNTVEVVHALLVAKAGGFDVPQATIDSGMAYLGDVESHFPSWYDQDSRDSLSADALDVRMIGGDRDADKAQALFDSRSDLPLDAVAWIWPVVDRKSTIEAISTIIQNRAVDTAGAATFTTAVSDNDYVTLRSDRRTDGIILDSLITVQSKSDLIPKVVAGLLASQTNGRWDNIQENSFILLAMKHYFDAFESQTPDFVARVWLGDRYAGDHTFAGRSTDRVSFDIPTGDLITATTADGGTAPLVIQKDGTGRLYYRIGLRTAPTSLDLDPVDRGFVVQRTYEAVDDPADVTRDADGTWHIKAGAHVRVRLTMVAESQRTHVALIDPLPAGLEILDADLATSPTVPDATTPATGGGVTPLPGNGAIIDYAPWTPTWFDHQNQRDDRAEAFSTVLAAGTYDYSYVATATTPGTFVVPPTRAEEMYSPETFGRAATDTVVVAG
ncbi:MAG: hypothetical protein JWM34_4080 [Ilumatobacteraceae bacterium]|nr:hypothetical protein [Ilumatobacteraceae bacterium]